MADEAAAYGCGRRPARRAAVRPAAHRPRGRPGRRGGSQGGALAERGRQGRRADRQRLRLEAGRPAHAADLRSVRTRQGRHRRHQLLRQHRGPGRHRRRQGRLQPETADRRTAQALPLRGPRGRGHRPTGLRGRRVHRRGAPHRAAARADRRRPTGGARHRTARRLRRRPRLVRRARPPRGGLHRRQPRPDPGQGPGLRGRQQPRRLLAAVRGTAVARHPRARPQGPDPAARRTDGGSPRRLPGVRALRRQGAGRAALGGRAPVGRDALLAAARGRRPGGPVPHRHGGGRPDPPGGPPAAAAAPPPGAGPRSRTRTAGDRRRRTDRGPAVVHPHSAPSENSPTTKGQS